jgi:tetratricopeptide (TPR) repeat protein
VGKSSLIRRKQIERQAEGYLELGMPQHALDNLDRLGGDENLGPRGLFLRGEAFKELDRHEEAVGALEKAADAMPGSVDLLLLLAWCYKRTGRIDLAIGSIEQGLEYEPNRALLHYNLACYLSLSGQKTRALTHLSRAFELDAEFRALVDREPDFDPIRSDPDFQAILGLGV